MKNQAKNKNQAQSIPMLNTDKPIVYEADILVSVMDVRYGNNNIEDP